MSETPSYTVDRKQDDPKYATLTLPAEAWRSMFAAWVEELDVDPDDTQPEDHIRPSGVFIGEDALASVAWFRAQAEREGIEELEPAPDAEEGAS